MANAAAASSIRQSRNRRRSVRSSVCRGPMGGRAVLPHLDSVTHPAEALRPALPGTLLALASAVAFGVTTPLVQRFGAGAGSFAVAALLYGGASLAGLLSRSPDEAAPRR